MQEGPKEDAGLASMFSLSLGAALVFFSIFWSIVHPGEPQRFAIAALLFAVPQLFLAPARRALASPAAMIASGAVLAAACALGSFLELQTALVHVYRAPWFLAAAWYFNVGCLLNGLKMVRRGGRKRITAVLHFSFVLVSLGMAVDGFAGREGVFKTSLKTAPGVMPPVEGYFAPGERSDTLVKHTGDKGILLPFEVELVSFDVEFYPSRRATLKPGESEVRLAGLAFRAVGFAFEGDTEPRSSVPADRMRQAYAVLEASARGNARRVAVPLDGTRRMGTLSIACRPLPPEDDKITGFIAEIEIKGSPKKFLSVVNVYKDGKKILENAHISVNHPLRVEGWSVYQSNWGRYVPLEEWEALPGNLRTPTAFEDYLDSKGKPPCSFFVVSRYPGKALVYAGYLLMFLSLIVLLSLGGGKEGGR